MGHQRSSVPGRRLKRHARLRRVLFLFKGTPPSRVVANKVLVTKQATTALFTWFPSDTGVSAWKVKTGPAVLSPKPRPWRHRGAMAVTARFVTVDETPVVRHPDPVLLCTVRFTPPRSFAVASPSRHNEARSPSTAHFALRG